MNMNDQQIVATGTTLYWSPSCKTFADFLSDYIKQILSSDWGNAEIPATGVVNCYLGVAYSLYIIKHNVELQDCLVKRLKSMTQF